MWEFIWEFVTEFLIPVTIMMFILYSSWNGMELRTGRFEVKLHPLKRFFKRKQDDDGR